MSVLRPGGAALFVFLGWVGMLAAGSLASVIHLWRFPPPDVGLTVVLYLALVAHGSPAAIAVVSAVLGYLADLIAGAPKGTHMLAFMAVSLTARALAWRLLLRGPLVVGGVAAVFATFTDLLLLGMRALLGSGTGWGAVRDLPLMVISTGLFAMVAFPLLGRVDRGLHRAPGSFRFAR